MPVRYSPSTGFFYPVNITYQDIPSDVFEVSEADHLAAHAARASGGSFKFVKGTLRTTPPPAMPYARVSAAYLDSVRARRDAILNRLAGIGFAAMADGDADTVRAITAARACLLDITICPTVAAAQDMAALQAAVNAEFARIAATLSDEARRAFDEAGTAAPQ
ncbi:hypothetical protein JAB5_41030 [Janthinobacterium sp. HH103]|uniref:hypothetical protein n=1 Tax=unclassified Janthinobacterium TaxID=2610881 RepID=UPI000874EBAB|nr:MULTISPECIES: hypothetical protein [unclassified Janthinobacterium]OEZ70033.1 hypothetical protein JAB2_10590 [Janthinobacterium sp. HH100]OEZ70973.1 hypothetical protein JAB5_41030 [Janthinobacterium sp. HH103]QOU74295.1 hypothetical protein JAB4_037580 [Janthinobacterium sp. HH102]